MNKTIPVRQSPSHKLDHQFGSFNKSRYISPDWLDRELQCVWGKTWQAAAHLSDLRQPGDYLVYELGQESILLACNDDGQIKAFYNVCQHRGVKLVDRHCGNSDGFRCPYHSWRYDNGGRLNYVPGDDSFQQGLPMEELSLPEVRCETALGFAWISLDSSIEPLQEYLEDMLPLMSHYEFEHMTLVQDQTVSINCNWKAVHDNFSELYHVPYLHPQHRRFSDCSNAINELYPRGHSRVWVPGATTDSLFAQPEAATDLLAMQLLELGLRPEDYDGRVDEIQDAIRKARRELAAEGHSFYGNFSDEELSDVMQTNVFPNCLFTHQPGMLWLMRLRPHATDPNRCYMDKLSFERLPAEEDVDLQPKKSEADANGGQRPEHDGFDYAEVIAGTKSMTDTIDQDLSLLAHAQQGMLSEGFRGPWLNEMECRVSHFHERLEEMIPEGTRPEGARPEGTRVD
jgi:phenylpropionate dioxygenase-like ring-hydroxylating dioxygenase large terminal subunit